MQEFHVALQVDDFLLQVVSIGIEFLSDGHRHGILQLGASHLDSIGILVSLISEGADESRQSSHQVSVHTDERQANGGRIHIIGTLTAVAMVVRRAILILALLVSHDFQGTVGDDLVGIHID